MNSATTIQPDAEGLMVELLNGRVDGMVIDYLFYRDKERDYLARVKMAANPNVSANEHGATPMEAIHGAVTAFLKLGCQGARGGGQ